MTNYSGRYIVINGTGVPIQDAQCLHQCGPNLNTTMISVPSLANGEATEACTLTSEEGRNDYWTPIFKAGKVIFARPGKQCNVEEEDTGGLCLIALYNCVFSIIPPVSSYCLLNYYSAFIDRDCAALSGGEDQQPVHSDGIKKVPGEGVNEDYDGSFIVINATNGPITDVQVIHTCDGKSQPFGPDRMAIDAVSPLIRTTSARWSSDHWKVSFRNAAGQLKLRDGKRCDYTPPEAQYICMIILYANDFSIAPIRDGCYHNYYG